jgi:hypothetical protein
MATGIPSSSFTPRKEVQELGGLTIKGDAPSVGINSFSRGINVTPQQAVQFGAPYVSTQQTANFINSLGQFNDAIRGFGMSYSKYDAEQNKMQGETDALGNPDQAREIFKKGLDQAVKDGLFPSNSHPVYRMNFMETAAQAQTLRDLPDVLEKSKFDLADPNNTSPIGQTLTEKTEEYIQGAYANNPLAANAARKQAQALIQSKQTEISGLRETQFRQASIQAVDQKGAGIVSGVVDAQRKGDEDSVPVYVQQFQSNYDEMYRSGVPNPAVRAWEQVKSGIMLKVRNGEMTSDEARSSVDALASQVKSGTGMWADIAEVKQGMAELDHTLTVMDDAKVSKNHTKAKYRDETATNVAQDVFSEAQRTGAPITDGMIEQAAQSLSKADPSITLLRARRLAQDSARAVISAAATAKSDPSILASTQDLVKNNPKEAILEIESRVKSGILTPDDGMKLKEEAKKNSNVQLLIDDAGSKELRSSVSSEIKGLFQGPMSTAALDPNSAANLAFLQANADKVYSDAAQSEAEQLIGDPSSLKLRETNPAAFNSKLREGLNKAKQQAILFASQAKKGLTENAGTVKDESFGQWAPAVATTRATMESVAKKGGSPDTYDKLYLASIPTQMRDIAQSYRYGNETQKKQAGAAYGALLKMGGYSPDIVISGKTPDGVVINAKEMDKDHDLFFQNRQQWDDAVNEYNKALQQPDQAKLDNTKMSKMFKTLGINDEDLQNAFLLRQSYLIKQRAIPSIDAIIKNPNLP